MNKSRTNGKISQLEQNNLDSDVSPAPLEGHFPGRLAETKLKFPTGQPDLDALRSVTRERLVPLLVEKFLRKQGIELRAPRQTNVGEHTKEL